MLARKLLAAKPVKKPSIVFTDSKINTSALASSVTHSNVNIGVAAATRIVAVAAAVAGGSFPRLIQSLTIGGISATKAVSAHDSGTTGTHEIWYAVVPTGTAADVVVNYDGTQIYPHSLKVAALYDVLSTTPITGRNKSESIVISPSLGVTLTPEADGVLFAEYGANCDSGTTASWTNATEQSDTYPSTGGMNFTAATADNLSGGSLTITATLSDATVSYPRLVVASWR
ncbi:hypothetical protein [Methylomicrobium agile]|uniref:hypothetical protein n=1 Tax=Methylomicrobium agile TaxID=39774 RepID=UPI0004DF1D0C|nr:hypothetical protein [Methylomicrobium agile]